MSIALRAARPRLSLGRMVRRVLVTTLIALAAAGCSSGGDDQAPDPAPPNPAQPTSAPPVSAAPTSAGASIVDVAYRNGQVEPANLVIAGKVGQPLQVNVSSDRPDDIVVDGYPDANADVDPTEPEDLDVTPNRTGTFTIRLAGANATLVTVEVS